MKKIILTAVLFSCFAFKAQDEKKVTISFTADETVLIYNALGETTCRTGRSIEGKNCG